MLIKFFKHFTILLGVLFLQLAVIPNLPGVLARLNLVLVVVIFVSVVYRFYIGIIYAFIWGFSLDVYSTLPFGATLIALLVASYVVYFLFTHFFTNKSLYTLLSLVVLGTLTFNVVFFIYAIAVYFNQNAGATLLKNLTFSSVNESFGRLLLNVAVGLVLFLVFHFSSHRFKAVFIDTTKA